MGPWLHRSFLASVLATLLVAQVSCAGRRVPAPTLAESTRTSLGTLAVSWIDRVPRVAVYSTHTAGRGAAQGASTGAKAGVPLLWVGQVPNIGGAVVGLAGVGVSLAGAIIGAPIGAIVGATKAPPKAAVKQVADTFAGHAAPLDVVGCVGTRIHQTLRQGTRVWSVLAPVSSATPGEDAGRHRALARQAIDTVIDVGPPTLEVSGPFGTHPDGALILTVPVRLVRVGDGTELLAHEFRWAQGAGPAAWPVDAQAFGEAIERACARLAVDVVHAVAGYVAPIEPASEPDDQPWVRPRE